MKYRFFETDFKVNWLLNIYILSFCLSHSTLWIWEPRHRTVYALEKLSSLFIWPMDHDLSFEV